MSGHYNGHFSGHYGPRIFRTLAQRLLGFNFDYLWLGNRDSVEKPATLTQVSGALEDQTPTGYNPSAWNKGLFQYPALGSSWRGPFLDFTDDLLVVVIFRAQSPLVSSANLASKREGSPNFLGWELFVDGSGRATLTTDSDLSAAQFLVAPTDIATSGLPQVVGIRLQPGQADLATVLDSVSQSLSPGSLASSADFSIGAGRLATSTTIEIGFCGAVVDNPSLRSKDLQQDIVFPVAVELTVSEVQGSTVVDSQGRTVYAWSNANA